MTNSDTVKNYPEIFFYFNAPDRMHSACQVIDAHYRKNPEQKMFVFCSSEPVAKELDSLLWRFKKMTFVPHAIYGSKLTQDTNVLIMHNKMEVPDDNVAIVSILDDPIVKWERANQIIEIVSINNLKEKELARARFRFYKERCKRFNHIDLSCKSI